MIIRGHNSGSCPCDLPDTNPYCEGNEDED